MLSVRTRNHKVTGFKCPAVLPDDLTQWTGHFAIGCHLCFSPEGTAQQVVLNTINPSKKSVRMMAYSFTSPEVVKALINAKKRGVDVRVVIDEKGNVCDKCKANKSAMNLLVNAEIPLRTVSKYKIMHDKVIITDDANVETGSYNFSSAANKSNSENAILITEVPELAKEYLQHWQSRWQVGQDWKSTY